MMITGKDLIEAGFPEGREFGPALEYARRHGLQGSELKRWVLENRPRPKLQLQAPPAWSFNLEAETPEEEENAAKVRETMDAVMRTPTVVSGAVMPDACPAGSVGTIPVGGVVGARNAIHPGMHSSDICCSVMLSAFDDAEPSDILDAVHQATHFGPGGRPNGRRYTMSQTLYDQFRSNFFLRSKRLLLAAVEQLGTQGDGNHFAFVGRSAATGKTCLVTHHGSRGPGAMLYKAGLAAAEKYRNRLSSGVEKVNAWLPADNADGREYWEALQLIRAWTKENHTCIHDAAAQIARAPVRERFWNEHNFVFRHGDIYYHAKGATPVLDAFLPDSSGLQIIPLNMAEPVLIVKGTASKWSLGFAPHGAGRNWSRTEHRRRSDGASVEEICARETKGLDVRFYCGRIDISELPSAYKNADEVRRQMSKFGLAEVQDVIEPYGCIMAGDWEHDAPWRRKRRGA